MLALFFSGQEIDGPQNGQAPGAWHILAEPDQLFLDHEKYYEVPHTASVKTCTNCDGEGVNRCWRCLGSGIVSQQLTYMLAMWNNDSAIFFYNLIKTTLWTLLALCFPW